MRLTLVAPFRTNISFDRKWISYDPQRIDKLWASINKNLPNQIADTDLGCYLLPINNGGRYYLDVVEPGKTYRQFYLARRSVKINPNTGLLKSFPLPGLSSIDVEIRILDHEFSLLNIDLQIDVESLFICINGLDSLVTVDGAINDFADSIFVNIKSQIEELIAYLATIPYVNISDATRPLPGTLLWVHKVWSISRDNNSLIRWPRIANLVSESTLTGFRETQNDFWGWGDSIRLASEEDSGHWREARWLHGMCLAQYFHTCFDWLYREIPFVIEKIKLESSRGRMARGITISLDFSHRGHLLLFDFTQCKLTMAGASKMSLSSLLRSWETTALSNGVKENIPYIRELATQADQKIKNWSQSSIELILFISAILSFVGLSFSLHDYLKPTNTSFPVNELSLPSSPHDVLSISSFTVLLGLTVYGLAKTGILARWTSMFKLTTQATLKRSVQLLKRRK